MRIGAYVESHWSGRRAERRAFLKNPYRGMGLAGYFARLYSDVANASKPGKIAIIENLWGGCYPEWLGLETEYSDYAEKCFCESAKRYVRTGAYWVSKIIYPTWTPGRYEARMMGFIEDRPQVRYVTRHGQVREGKSNPKRKNGEFPSMKAAERYAAELNAELQERAQVYRKSTSTHA